MKTFATLLLISCLGLVTNGHAQIVGSAPRDGEVTYFGTKYPCKIIEYNAPAEVVENSIKETMEARGYKAESKKGFLIYKNVILPNAPTSQPMDAYILVESKSRKEKDKSVAQIITGEPGKVMDGKAPKGVNPALGVMTTTHGAMFLEGLAERVGNNEFSRQMQLQEALIADEEKKMRKLESDQADMQKRLDKLKSDIEENKKAQEAQKAKLEAER
ncbi:MAG TPA: hypothetical protein PKD90_01000, partial [Phnomibacter sp.]|nr:hypothetical protein [Phnomibacter sp.]